MKKSLHLLTLLYLRDFRQNINTNMRVNKWLFSFKGKVSSLIQCLVFTLSGVWPIWRADTSSTHKWNALTRSLYLSSPLLVMLILFAVLPEREPNSSTFLTTSSPSFTLPNTTCRPSNLIDNNTTLNVTSARSHNLTNRLADVCTILFWLYIWRTEIRLCWVQR